MIVSLVGHFRVCNPNYVELEVGGIGYGLAISRHTYEQLLSNKIKKQKEGRLYVYHHFGDSGHQLFGFFTEAEKTLFTHLISVSGVGPALALTALSSHAPSQLQKLITAEQTARIQQIKGIGKKTAQRIVLELSEKLPASPESVAVAQEALRPQQEAIDALVSLGMGPSEAERNIARVLQNLEQEGIHELPALEVLVKRALRLSQ